MTAANRRRRIVRATLLALATALVLTAGAFFTVGPVVTERAMNAVRPNGPTAAGPQAQALHRRLTVVDLHADPLLWRRDLRHRSTRGHVDLPRLQAGNMALQVFGVVTKAPFGQNATSTRGDSDMISLLVSAQLWPTRTWTSLLERALYQADKLERFAAGSGGGLVVVRTASDLDALLAARSAGQPVVGGLLSLEGAHALEGDLANVDRLFDAGYRMLGIAHFFDNEVGGSAHGVAKGGLTELGVEVVERAQALGMIVDLAHASPAVIRDVTAMARAPVVVSHTGVRATCDNARTLSDDLVRRVAATDGLVGIGFWRQAVCDTHPDAIARAVRHVADLVGVGRVALGSDFNGAVATAFDVSQMALVTQALMDHGFDRADIALIMGGNAIRLFRAVLPR